MNVVLELQSINSEQLNVKIVNKSKWHKQFGNNKVAKSFSILIYSTIIITFTDGHFLMVLVIPLEKYLNLHSVLYGELLKYIMRIQMEILGNVVKENYHLDIMESCKRKQPMLQSHLIMIYDNTINNFKHRLSIVFSYIIIQQYHTCCLIYFFTNKLEIFHDNKRVILLIF